MTAAALSAAGCNVGGDPVNSERTEAAAAPAANEPPPRPPLKPRAQPARARLDELDSAEAAAEPAQAAPSSVTRAWFAGKWTDTGDCADAGQFAPSGIYQLADGTRGMWSVQDGRLIIQRAEGRNVVRLRKIDDNNVEVTNEDGSVGRSLRC